MTHCWPTEVGDAPELLQSARRFLSERAQRITLQPTLSSQRDPARQPTLPEQAGLLLRA